MRIQNKKTLASILFVLISFVCFAQVDGVPPPPAPTPPPGTPIDGGALLLLVGGAVYGVQKVITNTKY